MVNFKRKNKFIFWLMIPIFTLIVIMGVLYAYINSGYFRDNMKSILLTQLEKNLGLSIEIGNLDSISFQSLQLTDITVFEDSLSKEDILFQAEKIRARFNLFLSFLHWKNWQLNVHEITFYRASIDITRERNGEFDLLNKLELKVEEDQQNFFIERINFQDSILTFHDKLVINDGQDALTTQVKYIQGYLDLSQLPEIIFDFQGQQEKGDALLALQGKTSINQPEYSLVFHLENADIAHFQYYLEAVEQLNITQGKFNLSLHLEFSPEWEPKEALWQEEATFRQVSIQPNILEGIYFKDISGSVQFLKSEIKISKLKGFYRDSPISLQGVLITEPAVYFDFDIESEDIDTSSLIEDISLFIADYSDFSMQGSINLSGNIKGQLDDFQIEAKISSPKINIENIIFQNIDCSFSLNPNTLFINSLNIQDTEASLTLNGKIDWSEDIPFYQFFLETKYLSLQHPLFNHFSFLEDVSGNLVSQLKMESDRQDSSILDVEGQFVANSLKAKEIFLADSLQGKIKSVIHFSDNYINIDQGEFIYKQARGSLNGKINYSDPINFDLHFEGLVPQIDELIASTSSVEIKTIPAGSIEIKGSFTGHPENPEIYVEFYLQDFTFQDYVLNEVNGKLVFHENTISLVEFTLKNQDISLTGKGNIALLESGFPEIDLLYQFDTVAIDSLVQALKVPLPLSGQISGNGNLQGIWPGLVLKGSFQLEQIIYDGYPLGKGQVVFNLKPEPTMVTDNLDNLNNNQPEIFSWLGGYSYFLNLEKFILQNETISLSILGQIYMGEDNLFFGEIDFSHQNLADMVEYFYPIDNDDLKIFLPSRITGKAKLEGDRYEQQLTLSAQFKFPQQEDNLPTKLESIIKRNNQGFNISDLRLIQSVGQLKVEGNISLDKKLDIVFQAEELDLNTLLSLTQLDEVIKGIINIKGSYRGTISQPEISLIAQIKEGYFREFQFENLQSNLYWDSKTNIMEIREFVIALEQDYRIQAKGSLPLDALVMKKEEGITPETPGQDIPLDFQIKMDNTDMKILRLFWEDAFSEISGFIDMELNLTGTSRKPLVNGVIEVNQGKVTLADLPVDVEIEELNTRIEVSNNRVVIPSIRFIIYDHHFNLSGQLELMNFLPDHMLITIRNEEKRIVYQNIIECEADFLAEIKGSLLAPEIKGQLVLSKGNLNLDQLQALLGEGGLTNSILTATAPNVLLGKLDMNIEIVNPFSLRLTNTEIFITGKINLTGFLTQPNIQGNILLKRGNFIYFEKKFEISEGRISINGFTLNDIEINAWAQTNVQNIRIIIHIYGSLDNPQIRLSSEPSLKETEIISLLTLGRNIEGLSEGEIEQLLSQEMINIIFQSLQINIFKRLEREIAGQLGLDFLRLSIDKSITSDNQFFLLEDLNLADLTLEVGKNVGEKFFITYKTPLDFQGEKSISIDYKLSPLFTFNTQLNNYSFSLKENDYRLKFGLKINF